MLLENIQNLFFVTFGRSLYVTWMGKIYRLLIVDRVYYILSDERVMNNLIVLRN